jgi:hypothetical protein
MVLIVYASIAYGGVMDPRASQALSTDHIQFASREACEKARQRVILDAQAHQWTAAAVCVAMQ